MIQTPLFMGAKVQKNFRMEPVLTDRLKRFSYEHDVTETEVVEEAVSQYLAQREGEPIVSENTLATEKARKFVKNAAKKKS